MQKQKDLIKIALDWAAETINDSSEPVLWMDAATGAGNMTLQLAKLFKGKGHVISVDRDEKSWSDWAYPKLAKENLLDVVTFKKTDITDLTGMDERFNGIFSDTTLSVMGYSAVDAVSQWRNILHPNGRVIIRDYLPQGIAKNDDEEIANQAWRISKAIDALSGRTLYDEFPPEFWINRLKEFGFEINGFHVDDQRKMRSKESIEEWLSLPLELDLKDPELEKAFERSVQKLRNKVKNKGTMLSLSGTFVILATLKHDI